QDSPDKMGAHPITAIGDGGDRYGHLKRGDRNHPLSHTQAHQIAKSPGAFSEILIHPGAVGDDPPALERQVALIELSHAEVTDKPAPAVELTGCGDLVHHPEKIGVAGPGEGFFQV